MPLPTNPGARRGRPKDLAKREALLDATRSLLLTQGLAVTTESIIEQAGVSKATLYANFSDKQALIEAVLSREAERIHPDTADLNDDEISLEATLLAFGIRYLSFVNERRLSGWSRLIIQASELSPDLARRLFVAGPGRGYAELAKIIARAIETGKLTVDSPQAAAGDLRGLWLGFVGVEINLYVRSPLQPDEIEERARRGVDIFMRLYGNRVC